MAGTGLGAAGGGDMAGLGGKQGFTRPHKLCLTDEDGDNVQIYEYLQEFCQCPLKASQAPQSQGIHRADFLTVIFM